MSFAQPDRLLVDGGTTTTRVWAVAGREVLAEARATVGARDTARDGSKAALHAALARLAAEATAAAAERRPGWTPASLIAAGMITSPLGLAEVQHVDAPAGLDALAAGARALQAPEVTPLPVLLLPGVRCGTAAPAIDDIAAFDVMRGEEAVCLGLVATGGLAADGVAMSVGSHWKLVELQAGRITGCSTTLGGELLHVLRTQTVLAQSVAGELPDALSADDLAALDRGMVLARAHGLARAGFMTRLLERVAGTTARSRLLFLLGVVVGDIHRHWRRELDGRAVVLIGAPAVAGAWRHAISAAGGEVRIAQPADVTAGYVAALVEAAARAG